MRINDAFDNDEEETSGVSDLVYSSCYHGYWGWFSQYLLGT